MDEQDLLEQYKRTGNLMDLFQDETWVRKMVRIEEEADCDIGAGVEWGICLGKVFANPTVATSRRSRGALCPSINTVIIIELCYPPP